MSNTLENPDSKILQEPKTKCGFIALLGPANAGKSSILNALIGSKVSIVTAKEQTTRFRVLGIKTFNDSQMVFIDTPGFLARRYRGALSKYISAQTTSSARDCDASVLVLDSVLGLKDKLYIQRAIESFQAQGIKRPDIIALNKIDLLDKLQLLPLFDAIYACFKEHTPEIIPVSAKHKDGLEIIERVLLNKIPEGPFHYPIDQNSDQAEHVMAAEIIREKLMNKLDRELPYSIIALIQDWKFRAKTLYISVEIVVDKESQKKIVIGAGGSLLKAVGQEARKELEKLFEVPVFLDLRVKVQRDWTKDNLKVEQWQSRLLS